MRKRGSWVFAHWQVMTWAGHENWPDLRSRISKIQDILYKLYELLASSCSKSLKTWVQNCGSGRMPNLLNCVLRWRHITWPGGLTWYDLGSKFSHKMRKGWMNSYAKYGGASRRRYYAICEKPMGAHMCPPAVRGLMFDTKLGSRLKSGQVQVTKCHHTQNTSEEWHIFYGLFTRRVLGLLLNQGAERKIQTENQHKEWKIWSIFLYNQVLV